MPLIKFNQADLREILYDDLVVGCYGFATADVELSQETIVQHCFCPSIPVLFVIFSQHRKDSHQGMKGVLPNS